MGDGSKENPYTREDVLEWIAHNDGRAAGLDLSLNQFEGGIDLSDLDLSGINLNSTRLFRANLNGSNLDGAVMQKAYLGYATFTPLKSKAASLQGIDLRNANLHDAEFRKADLTGAQFQATEIQAVVHPPQLQGKLLELLPASLERTDFSYANLFRANFKGCYFYSTKLEGAFIRGADIFDAHLEQVDWGSYKIGEESKKEELHFAESIYRRLKQWYMNAGHYDIAGEFLFREMEAKRKNLRWLQPPERRWLGWWPLRGQKVRLSVYKWLYGYGERPWRVVLWGLLVLFGLALIYFFLRGVAPYTLTTEAFLGSLYYSAVSFTALGYGPWFSPGSVRDWVQGVGAAESFIGVFMIALFLVTFVRKMTR